MLCFVLIYLSYDWFLTCPLFRSELVLYKLSTSLAIYSHLSYEKSLYCMPSYILCIFEFLETASMSCSYGCPSRNHTTSASSPLLPFTLSISYLNNWINIETIIFTLQNINKSFTFFHLCSLFTCTYITYKNIIQLYTVYQNVHAYTNRLCHFNLNMSVFSSPEKKAKVRFSYHNFVVPRRCRYNFSYCLLLLQNHLANLNQTWQKKILIWRRFKFVPMQGHVFS